MRPRRGLWAGLLAALGFTTCAACCATPVIVAAGLFGASGVVVGWLPTVGVLLVAAAALVLVLPIRGRRCRRCGGEGAGCGCGADRDPAPESRSTPAP